MPAPPLLPPAGRAPPPRLPLGDVEGPADGGAPRAGQLGLSVADEVLEERAARQQPGRRQLQEQREQEGGGQRQPQRAQRVQRRERGPRPASHGPGSGLRTHARHRAALPPASGARLAVTRHLGGTRGPAPGSALPSRAPAHPSHRDCALDSPGP